MDWEKLVNKYRDSLLLYVRQWCNDLSFAEEIVQESYLKLWGIYQKEPKKIESPISYLFKISRSLVIDFTRKEIRNRKQLESINEFIITSNDLFKTDENSNFDKYLAKQLLLLPMEQREIIIMKIWGELTFKEISANLNISIGTTTSRYRYGLKKLKHLINQMEK